MKSDTVSPEHHINRLPDWLMAQLPLTFRGQATLLLVPMIIIISAVYTLMSISTERSILRSEIIDKGETIAAIAAGNAELPLLSENLEQLKSSALSVLKIKDVEFVSFLNKNSEVLLHEGKQSLHPESFSGTGISFYEDDSYFEFIVPVVSVKASEEFFLLESTGSTPSIKEQIGWVRIGLSKEVMKSAEKQILVRGFIIAALFSTAGVLLLYIFISLATRPLYALINAVQEVGEGEHPEIKVSLPRSEIGVLAIEFNRMSRAIKEREGELQENIQELERQIEAREAAEAVLAQTIDSLHEEMIERKLSEEDRARLAKAIEQVAEAIFICDTAWNIAYLNPAFEIMNGYSRDEMIGSPIQILSCEQSSQDNYSAIMKSLEWGEIWTGRILNCRKDGSTYEAETTVSPVKNNNGDVINYVCIQRDVTHEVKLERELRQAQKMEAIGTLAGGIAHDFNNILTAIIGYTDMAQHKLSNNDAVSLYLEKVQNAGARAKELVNRILTFSRKSEQERKPVHLASIIDEVLQLLRATLPSTIEIQSHNATTADSDTVSADPTQIHQVLMNLGTNAAHAMREQGGILSVSLTDFVVDGSLSALYPNLIPGACVKLTVSDTGHGMEPGVRERIFDPYFTTKKVGEGTGMGLAVVQGIINSHGGAISVYSEPGKGTTFHIFLPKFEGGAAHEVLADEPVCAGTERILFVDDEAILAELGKAMLELLGYTVTITVSSRDALDLFRSAPDAFDLIITDMTMPGLTGKELARELLSIRSDIPIILCTGFSEHINEEEAKESGIKGYILKPYASKSLSMIIRSVLAVGH